MKPIFTQALLQTRYPELSPTPQESGEPQPAIELPIPEEAVLVALPDPAGLTFPATALREVIENRRSARHYSPQPLSLEELSALLWLTQGVQKVTRRPITLRPVPSAGARHAFETILLVNRVEGLQPGLYRYIATRHALINLAAPADIAEQIRGACLQQDQITGSAVTFIWMAVTERMAWRYVERSLRYLHLDAGHVCQNLYLAGEAIGCGTCAIAAFEDEKMNEVLGLDGVEQFVIYLASIGKRRDK
jgi:SagB-type dehydrogenase family enzyme